MDQSNSGEPNENNDSAVDSTTPPMAEPQQPTVPIISDTNTQPATISTEQASPVPVEPPSEPLSEPMNPEVQQTAAPIVPPTTSTAHKNNHVLLISLVVATVVMLATAAYFAFAA